MKKELLKNYQETNTAGTSRSMETAIHEHLDTMAEENENFRRKYDPEKFGGCIKWVISCARDLLKGKNGEVSNEICYKMARDYFEEELWKEEEEEKASKESKTKKTVQKKQEKPVENKAPATEVKTVAPSEPKTEKKAPAEQMALFDLAGVI